MVQKPKYDKNVVTTKPWEPKQLTGFKTANNRSSECMNIITGETNTYSAALTRKETIQNHYGRVKGVTEIQDLLHSSKANKNADHSNAIGNN